MSPGHQPRMLACVIISSLAAIALLALGGEGKRHRLLAALALAGCSILMAATIYEWDFLESLGILALSAWCLGVFVVMVCFGAEVCRKASNGRTPALIMLGAALAANLLFGWFFGRLVGLGVV